MLKKVLIQDLNLRVGKGVHPTNCISFCLEDALRRRYSNHFGKISERFSGRVGTNSRGSSSTLVPFEGLLCEVTIALINILMMRDFL